MITHSEAGRAAGRDRTSEVVLARNTYEVANRSLEIQTFQAAHLSRRFILSDSLARCLAEMAFDHGRLR